jgi:hypothetical protein
VIAQRHQFTNTQGFRSIVIALLAVVALAGAAFFFGTGLRADTAQSVAPSPLGSSLTNVRGSQSVDYVGRLINSSAAARSVAASPLGSSLTNVRGSQSVARSPLGSSLTAVRQSRFEDRYDRMNTSSAAVTSASAGLSNLEYARKFDIPAAAVTRPRGLSNLEAARWAAFSAGLDKALKDAGARP